MYTKQQLMKQELKELRMNRENSILQPQDNQVSQQNNDYQVVKNNLFRLTQSQFDANVFLIREIISKLERCQKQTEKGLKESIVEIYELLMEIPYKYGRVNLSKGNLGASNKNEYVTGIGLPYLVKEIKENPQFNISENLKKEIITKLPFVFKQFLMYQYREEYVDKSGHLINYTKQLAVELAKEQQEINKIEALNYTQEEKQKINEKIRECGYEVNKLKEELSQLEKDIDPIMGRLNQEMSRLVAEHIQPSKQINKKPLQSGQSLEPSDKLRQSILEQEEALQDLLEKIVQLELDMQCPQLSRKTLEENHENNSFEIKKLMEQLNKDNANLNITREKKPSSKEERQQKGQRIEELSHRIEDGEAKIKTLIKENISLKLSMEYADLPEEEKPKIYQELRKEFEKKLNELYINNKNALGKINKELEKIEVDLSKKQGEEVTVDKVKEKNSQIKELKKHQADLDTSMALLKKQNNSLEIRIKTVELTVEVKKNRGDELKEELSLLEIKEKDLKELRDIAKQKDYSSAKDEYKKLEEEYYSIKSKIEKLNRDQISLVLEINRLKYEIADKNSIDRDQIYHLIKELQAAKAEGNKLAKEQEKKLKQKKELAQDERSESVEEIKFKKEIERVSQRLKQAKLSAKPFTENSSLGKLQIKLMEIDKEKGELSEKLKGKGKEITQCKNEMRELEKKEKEKEKLLNTLPELKKKIKEKKEIHELIISRMTDEYEFIELAAFQKEYDQQHAHEMLVNFRKNLSIADNNVTILLAIINFVSWQKEYCGEAMASKIENIVTTKCLKNLRGFRNQAMHGLDDLVALNQMTDLATSQALKEDLKPLVLELFDCLLDKDNEDYLSGKKTAPGKIASIDVPYLNQIETCLPQLLSNKEEDGQDRQLGKDEQLNVLTSSVRNGQNIIKIINQQLIGDKDKFPLQEIIKIMESPDNKLSNDQRKIKLKYDALLQGLGQAIGNLQQYSQLPLTSEVSISPEQLNNDFLRLNLLVPKVKDYRSGRTHNGYYSIPAFESALTDISTHNSEILNQLDIYLNTIKEKIKSESEEEEITSDCQMQ